MMDILRKSKWLVAAALFAFCVAPTFISYQPYLFRWDDSDYLQRSIAVSRAFWAGNVHGLGVAMVSIRPPAMTLLGLPWGPLVSWDAAGKCFITLAAAISLLAATCLYLLLRIGVKPFFLVAAAVCVSASLGPYPPGATAHAVATGFMADSLLAWTTLAAMLLIPYEARTDSSSPRTAVLRGLLWASILCLGAMTKVSFLYFVVLILPALVFIRLRRSGLRSALTALVAFACWSIPSAVYLVRWGGPAFATGKASSFGPLANLYYHPLLQFLGEAIKQSPGLVISFVLTAAALLYLLIKRGRNLLGPDFLPLLIMIGFGIVALASTNRVIRFEFPVIVTLPFLTAILLSGRGGVIRGPSAALVAGLVFCGLLAASVPMRHRADRRILSRPEAILAKAANCSAKSIILATDSPTLNKNLMDLAVEFSAWGGPVKVETLAFHPMSDVQIDTDLRAISEADQVVFQDRNALSPPFTNQRAAEYERYVQQSGYSPTRIGDDVDVYSIRCGG